LIEHLGNALEFVDRLVHVVDPLLHHRSVLVPLGH